MKNWKTTATGCAVAAAYALISYFQSGGLSVKDGLIAAGFAAIGVLAKDLNVTGGTVNQ